MDADHPQYNPFLGHGWIKHGKNHEVRSDSGRQRLDINSAIGFVRLASVVRDNAR